MLPSSRRRIFELLLLSGLGALLFASNPYVTFIDDEAAIVTAAAAPLRQTLHAFWIGEGVHEHPPLYDILLHFWLRITGGAFSALRLPSIGCYLLGLWLLSRAAEKMGGPRSARAVLWLGALWPFGYHYGRLAAWYSFCFLIVAALTLAYLRLVQEPYLGRWCITLFLAAALVYTNYFGWAFLICLAFDFVWREREAKRRVIAPLFLSALILGLTYLPLWRAFLNELRTGPSFVHSPAATVFLGGFHLYNVFVSESVAPWVLALGVPACLCIAVCLVVALKCCPPQARRFLLYALVLCAAMTALGIISSKRLLPVAAWILLPVGVAWSILPRGRDRALLSTALVAIFLLGWFGIFSRQYYSAPRFIEPWGRVAADAAGRSRSGALVIGNNPSFFFYLRYALRRPGGSELPQAWSAADVFSPGDWMEKGEPLRREVFFVRGAPGPLNAGDPWNAEQWLDARCHLISEQALLPDPAAHLKAKYLPELGELPWRILTRDYSCAAAIENLHK